MRFAIYDATGRIDRIIQSAENQIEANLRAGEAAMPVADDVTDLSHRMVDGEPVAFPAKPGAHHVWDWAASQWTDPRTLADLKAAKWREIKAARTTTEFGGFTWDGSAFDSDQVSQSRIQGAAQLATLAQMQGQPFAIDWTLADNGVRTLSAQDMIAVGVAMGMHIQAQHHASRLLRDQINAATTAQEVEAITWGAP